MGRLRAVLGASVVSLALLSGCAQETAAPADELTTDPDAQTEDPDARTAWSDNTEPSAEELGAGEWELIDDLDWRPSLDPTENFKAADARIVTNVIADWAKAGSFSDDVLYAEDFDSALDVVGAAIDNEYISDALREYAVEQDSPVGFVTMLSDDTQLYDDVRAHVQWKTEETEVDGVPVLHGVAAVSSLLPLQVDEGRGWSLVFREYHYTSTNPSGANEFWVNYSFVRISEDCTALQDGRIRPVPLDEEDTHNLRETIAYISNDQYTGNVEIMDFMTNELDLEETATDAVCPTTTPTASG